MRYLLDGSYKLEIFNVWSEVFCTINWDIEAFREREITPLIFLLKADFRNVFKVVLLIPEPFGNSINFCMFSLGSLSIPIPPKKPNQRLCGYQVQLCTQVQYYSVLVQVRGYHAFLIFILPLYVHCGFIVRVLRYFNTWLDCSLITLLLAEYVIAFSLVVKIFLLVFVTPEWIAL